MILEPQSRSLREEPHLQLVACGGSSEPLEVPGVDLWLWDLEDGSGMEESSSLLSGDERARAVRLREGPLRRRFVQSRCLLRRILGRRLSVPPEGLVLRYTESGKPFLESDYGLEFSVSHSGSLLLLGVSKGTVGVDIEGIRSMPELEAVGRLVFTPGEMAVVEDDPRGRRLEAFFRLWTGKEALLKGLGVGFLSDPLEVELRPASFGFRATPSRPTATPTASREAEWSVASLRVASASGQRLGFAAVALPVRAETFRVYTIPGPYRGSRGADWEGASGCSGERLGG